MESPYPSPRRNANLGSAQPSPRLGPGSALVSSSCPVLWAVTKLPSEQPCPEIQLQASQPVWVLRAIRQPYPDNRICPSAAPLFVSCLTSYAALLHK